PRACASVVPCGARGSISRQLPVEPPHLASVAFERELGANEGGAGAAEPLAQRAVLGKGNDRRGPPRRPVPRRPEGRPSRAERAGPARRRRGGARAPAGGPTAPASTPAGGSPSRHDGRTSRSAAR